MKITLDTFVISDTHFGQISSLKKEPCRLSALQNSNFKSFDDLSVSYWNHVVNDHDSILHLGDLYFKDGDKFLKLLNGKKSLIVGNNDIGKYEKLKDWDVIDKIKFKLDNKKELKSKMQKKWGDKLHNPFANALIVQINGIIIMFSHFPVHERKKDDRYNDARDIIDYAYNIAGCDINIHGHLHSKNSVQKYCINVSTEKLHFRPRKLREILCDYSNTLNLQHTISYSF